MTAADLLDRLAGHQQLLLETVCRAGDPAYRHQFHPDLSPLGWHLGHCVYTDIYWIRETILGDPSESDPLKNLYVPEFAPKRVRAALLDPLDLLCEWAAESQARCHRFLTELVDSGHKHPLLHDLFLVRFLNEHYAQHHETTMYILAQQRIKDTPVPEMPAALKRAPVSADAATVPGGSHEIGAQRDRAPYDNEHPAFTTQLDTFEIARRPVSNAQFLGFMEDGGYHERRHWSEAGRRWLESAGCSHPEHWRRNGGWHGIDDTGPVELAGDAPVYGINRHEAEAFARWAGARLPHEYEWEAARRRGVLEDTGAVWEWCDNPFHPYDGFNAWPYEGYSLPYFDDRHFILRGGSRHTRDMVRRDSFRNYYLADKRHVFAGLRLVFE